MSHLYSSSHIDNLANNTTGWSNSKRPSARFAKYSACANSVVMLSRRRMNRKREFCRLMIPRGKEEDMVRWLVAGTEKKALRCIGIGIGIARVRSTCLYAYVWDMMNSETACSPRLSLNLLHVLLHMHRCCERMPELTMCLKA